MGAVAQVTGGEERDKTLVEDLIVFKDQMDTVVDVAFARRQPLAPRVIDINARGGLKRDRSLTEAGPARRQVLLQLGEL